MGKLKTDVAFIEKSGRTFSKRTEYYENGQVAQVGVYVNNQRDWSWTIPTGVVKSYFENGQLKSEISYNENGSLEGESNYFNSEGKLVKKLRYSKDILQEEVIYEAETEKL